MNRGQLLLLKKSPAAIILIVLVFVFILGHFEYRARSLQNQEILIHINKPYTEQKFRQSDEEYITEVMISAAENSGDDSVDIFTEVRTYFEDGNYPEALSAIHALAEIPENQLDSYLLYSALIHTRLGDIAAAEADYNNLLDLYPRSFAGHYNLGLLYFEAGRYERSIGLIRESLKLAGGLSRAKSYRLLGRIYLKQEQAELAAENFREAILLEPADEISRIYLAEIAWERKRNYNEALEFYDEVVRLNPESGPLYLSMSEMEKERGNTDKALDILNEAKPLVQDPFEVALAAVKLMIELGELQASLTESLNLKDLYPERSEPEFQIGRIYYQRRDYGRAEESFRKSIELSGEKLPETLNNLGLALSAQQKWDEALNVFQEALEIDPLYATANYNIGLVFLDSGDLLQAEESFRRAVELEPQYQAAWYNLGVVLADMGNIDDSIRAYEEALLQEPDDLKSRLNLAVQYKKAGAVLKSLEQYVIVLKLNPDYATAWYNLALLQKSTGDVREAENSYRKALELEPDQVAYWLNLSVLLTEQQRIAESISLLRDALEIHADSSELRYNLGLQLKKIGQLEQAGEEWTIVTRLDPEFAPAWKSLGYLYSDDGNHEEALNAFLHGMDSSEDGSYLEYLVGKEYLALERPDDALKHFLKALEDINDNAFLWLNTGRAYLLTGQQGKSADAFSEALKIDSQIGRYIKGELELVDAEGQIYLERIEEDSYNPVWYIQLSEIYVSSNNYSDAVDLLQNAIEKIPGNYELAVSLAEVYELQDDSEKAEDIYRSLMHYNDAEVLYRLASIYKTREIWDQAENFLTQGLNADPEHLKSLKLLGEVQYELENYDNAAQILERAIVLDPESGMTWIDLGKAYYRLKDYSRSTADFSNGVLYNDDYVWSYIWLGRSLRKQKEYEKAEEVFLEGTGVDPDEEQTWVGLGDLKRELGDKDSAREFYSKALSLNPTSNTIRRRLESLE